MRGAIFILPFADLAEEFRSKLAKERILTEGDDSHEKDTYDCLLLDSTVNP
jgi:hypothetical protein